MNVTTTNKQYKLAKRYATALFKLNADEIKSELNDIVQTVENNIDLKVFLQNRLIKVDDKKDVLTKVFQDISKNTKNFLYTLLDNKKIEYLNSITAELNKMVNDKNNIKEAYVSSAVELTNSERARLKAKLENKFSKTFNINYSINKDIICGLLIKIEDSMLDLTARTKLNNLKKQLI